MRTLRTRLAAVTLTLAAAGGVAAPGAAQQWLGEASLGVAVKSSKGSALNDAVVTIAYRDIGFGDGPAARRTNDKGEVNYRGIASGTWSLKIDHPDHLSYMATLVVRRGKKPEILTEFLEATGPGRLTMRVKYLKGVEESRGVEIAAPSPPAASPTRPVAEATAPEPAIEESGARAPGPEKVSDRAAPEATAPEPLAEAGATTPAIPTPTLEAPEQPVEQAALPPGKSAEAEMPSAPPAEPATPTPAPRPGEISDAPPPPSEPLERESVGRAADSEPAPSDRPTPATPAAEATAVEAVERPAPATSEAPPTEPMAATAPPTEPTPTAPPEEILAAVAAPAAEPEPVPAPPTPETVPTKMPARQEAPPTTSEAPPTEPMAATAPPMEPTPTAPPEEILATAAAPPVEPKPVPVPPTPETAPTKTPARQEAPPATSEAPSTEPMAATAPPTEPTRTAPPEEILATTAAPSGEPPVSAPTPPAVPLEESPLEPDRASLSSFRDRSCLECRPGEWAISSTAVVSALDDRACPTSFEADVERTIGRFLETRGSLLTDYAGPFPPSSAAPGDIEAVVSGRCRLVAIALPQGARYTGFRLQAGDQAASVDCQGTRECPIGAARWLAEPALVTGDDATVVYGVFRNDSPASSRTATLTVFFLPPADWELDSDSP